MNWLTAPVIAPLLCGTMLIVTLMRIAVPVGQPASGDALGVISLRFRERLRLQRINIYLIGIVLILGTIGGWLRPPLNLIVILATFVIVSIPVEYAFTADGIARNRVVFRHWDEFSGVREEVSRFVLLGTDGAADFPLLLAPNQQAEARRLLASVGITPIAAMKTARGGVRVGMKGAKGGSQVS